MSDLLIQAWFFTVNCRIPRIKLKKVLDNKVKSINPFLDYQCGFSKSRR